MDYTQSDANVTHLGTGNRMHQDTAPITTVVSADDMNQIFWSLMEVVKDAGLAGVAFNADSPTSYRQLLMAMKTLFMAADDARDYVTNRTGESLSEAVARAAGRRIELATGSISASGVTVPSGGLRGKGTAVTHINAAGTTEALRLGWGIEHWAYRGIEALTIDGNAKASDGVSFEADGSTEVSGRWVLDKLVIRNCRRGVLKSAGNIGNVFNTLHLTGCDFGYYAVGMSSPLMHAGCDTFVGGEFSANLLAGAYIDSPQSGTGGTVLQGTIIEYNPGFGLFVKNWADSFTPLVLDRVWFEGNATAAVVTINGQNYVPVDIHLENARQVVLVNGVVPKIRLIASRLSISRSMLSHDTSRYDIDGASHCYADDVQINGGAHPILIGRITTIARQLGNFAARWRAEPRVLSQQKSIVLLEAESFSMADQYIFTGTSTVVAGVVPDGLIFGSCAELLIPAGNTQTRPAVAIISGKWVLLTVDIKLVTGALADLRLSYVGSGPAFAALHDVVAPTGWTTVAAMGFASSAFTAQFMLGNAGVVGLTVRLSALQVVQFDTEHDMLDYYNKKLYSPGSVYPRTVYSSAIPTVGNWNLGDRVINAAPVSGQPTSWVCRVAGTPGTWVSEGNLA